MMNETNEFFKYTVKGVDKINQTAFLINSEADLLVDLNDDYSVSRFFVSQHLYLMADL